MKQSLSKVKQPKRFDFILTVILVLIFISSIIAIYSAAPQIPTYLNANTTLMKQILFYILGFIVILVIMYIGNDSLFDFAVIGYKIFMGMLIYLFISMMLYRFTGHYLPLASATNGAVSWIDIPILNIQPSEFMKIILIIITGYVIKEHNEDKIEDSFENDISLFIKVGKWAIPPMILIFLQPDTGICIIIAFSLLLMLSCSGIHKEWIIYSVIVLVILVGAFLFIFYTNKPLFTSMFGDNYKMDRIYGWLEVEKYPNGAGYQLYSSLLAIGSSGWFGHGIQSNIITITEPHTDFIFAIIGLGFGYLGCLLVVGLCVALDFRLGLIAIRTNNQFEKLMITGFLGMLIFQQLENIGMVIGLLPITGITLPLISYGGSSMLSYMVAFGIVMNASLKAKKLSDYVYD
ncbi:MAG: FtsW/RodA/SpoVE family cell cycle protein [Bacilli bacterium]|nr:FtsW/RodA/SpoVE family cell cycle protein [Bacilli bacterium]